MFVTDIILSTSRASSVDEITKQNPQIDLTVGIIASTTTNEESIDVFREYLNRIYGHVYYPERVIGKDRLTVDLEFLRKLDRCNLVFAITKPDGTFGESTTFEYAYCINRKIPVVICRPVEPDSQI